MADLAIYGAAWGKAEQSFDAWPAEENGPAASGQTEGLLETALCEQAGPWSCSHGAVHCWDNRS
jgi:hypothetical protein